MGLPSQCGDVFFYRAFDILSRIVRFLIGVRYGIPVREAFSHVDIAYDEERDVSAETSGVKYVQHDQECQGKEVFAFRFQGLSEEKKKLLREAMDARLGKGYAFARYLLDACRIISLVVALISPIAGIFSRSTALIFLGVFILLQLASLILKRIDKKTKDCSELTAEVLMAAGLFAPVSRDPRNEFPNSIFSKMQLLTLFGQAALIGHKPRNGDWE
jgi:uncharacterized membrane protein YvlD (DUF360 family)